MADKVVIQAEVKSNVGQVGKDASQAAGEFKILGVSLNSVKAGFVTVGKQAKLMFGSIKAGLISTGIGAFIVAIGSLVSYFTNTKRGADLLKQAMAGLGAVVDVLTDLMSRVGETMFNAFTNPKQAIIDLWNAIKTNLMNRLTGVVDGFKAAGKMIQSALKFDWDAVKEGAESYGQALVQVGTGLDVEQQEKFLNNLKDITSEMEKEVKAMMALEKRTQSLRDADNEFMVQKAATRQEIERARLIAEDETKSAKERLDNLKKALELESETTKREIELARERMNIQKEEMALSENLAEDEAELARLKAAVIETETASLKMRRRVVTEVNALEREIAAEEAARAKEKQDRLDKIAKAEADAAKKAADKAIKEAKRVADEKLKLEQKVENDKQKAIAMGFDGAEALMKKGSKAAKAVAVARTIYNTQQAIMNAMANISPPWNLVQAAATAAMGAASIKEILSTSPDSASSGGGAVPTAAPQTPAPQTMGASFDLRGGTAPEPVQAFVVSDDITNNQDKLAAIRRRATI
jgi:hypothetical protein